MRDKTHMQQVERWAKFVKEHPDEWQQVHTQFINSVYDNAYTFIERLSKEEGGKEKIAKLYGIKNRKGYPSLFKK